MSSLVERRNPDTGEIEYGLWSPGGAVVPISREEAEAMQRGRGENFLRQAGSGIADSIGFMLTGGRGAFFDDSAAGFETPLETLGQEIMRSNDAAQAGRRAADPFGTTAGDVAAIGAELAVPGGAAARPRAGVRLADRFRRTAQQSIDEAATPTTTAARRAATSLDDANPSTAGSRSVGAAEAPAIDPREVPMPEGALPGFLRSAQVDELAKDFGFKGVDDVASRGMKEALDADTAEGLARAEARQSAEELYSSDVLQDRLAGRGRSITGQKENARELTARVITNEMGMPNGVRITNKVGRDLYDGLANKFDELAKEAGDLRLTGQDMRSIEGVLGRTSANDMPIVERLVQDITSDVQNGVLNKQIASQYRTRLSRDIASAAKNGEGALMDRLGEIEQVLDNITVRQLRAIDPDLVGELTETRYRYRIFKALEKTRTTTDAGGNINVRSFVNNLEAFGNNRFGRSLAKAEEGARFMDRLETLEYLGRKVEPSSGTAQRLLSQATVGRLGAGGALGAAYTGFGGN